MVGAKKSVDSKWGPEQAFRAAKARLHIKSASAENSNPFDKFSNSRKKHEVLNRRVKGEDRNVGRARKKV